MGFVALGIASGTPQGLQGALFANVAHGVITSLLFLVAGGLKDRYATADLGALLAGAGGGLRDRLPRFGGMLVVGCIAGLGLPGLAGFWGEFLAVYGAWQADGSVASQAFWRVLAALAVVGTVLAAAYLLRVLRLLWHGEPRGVGPDVGHALGSAGAPVVGPVVGQASGSPQQPSPLPDDRPGVVPVDVEVLRAGGDAAQRAGELSPALLESGARAALGLPRDVRPGGAVVLGTPPGHDASTTEVVVGLPLLVLSIVPGLLPWLLLATTDPAVRHLLAVDRGVL
jgi:NADH-quinone oxidoreductase subunit M